MAYKGQLTPATTITLDPANANPTRVYSRLQNATQTYFIDLVLTAAFTIAGAAAAAILNRGSLLAALKELGLEENGRDRVRANARVLRFITEASAISPLSATRLTSTAVGVTNLVETIRIYFASPWQMQPGETAFMELNTQALVQVFAQLLPNAAAKIATAGAGGTVTLGNVTITVKQKHDRFRQDRPVFIPTIRDYVVPVASSNEQLQSFLQTPNYLAFLVLSQEVDNVEVDDIINKVALRGDSRDIMGPQGVPWDDLVREQEFEMGGAVVSNKAHAMLKFADYGRLSNLINPSQDTNLRLEMDVQPSATVGNSGIRVTLGEMERTPGVVSETIPFPV